MSINPYVPSYNMSINPYVPSYNISINPYVPSYNTLQLIHMYPGITHVN